MQQPSPKKPITAPAVTPPTSLSLHIRGPPNCGKTTLANALLGAPGFPYRAHRHGGQATHTTNISSNEMTPRNLSSTTSYSISFPFSKEECFARKHYDPLLPEQIHISRPSEPQGETAIMKINLWDLSAAFSQSSSQMNNSPPLPATAKGTTSSTTSSAASCYCRSLGSIHSPLPSCSPIASGNNNNGSNIRSSKVILRNAAETADEALAEIHGMRCSCQQKKEEEETEKKNKNPTKSSVVSTTPASCHYLVDVDLSSQLEKEKKEAMSVSLRLLEVASTTLNDVQDHPFFNPARLHDAMMSVSQQQQQPAENGVEAAAAEGGRGKGISATAAVILVLDITDWKGVSEVNRKLLLNHPQQQQCTQCYAPFLVINDSINLTSFTNFSSKDVAYAWNIPVENVFVINLRLALAAALVKNSSALPFPPEFQRLQGKITDVLKGCFKCYEREMRLALQPMMAGVPPPTPTTAAAGRGGSAGETRTVSNNKGSKIESDVKERTSQDSAASTTATSFSRVVSSKSSRISCDESDLDRVLRSRSHLQPHSQSQDGSLPQGAKAEEAQRAEQQQQQQQQQDSQERSHINQSEEKLKAAKRVWCDPEDLERVTRQRAHYASLPCEQQQHNSAQDNTSKFVTHDSTPPISEKVKKLTEEIASSSSVRMQRPVAENDLDRILRRRAYLDSEPYASAVTTTTAATPPFVMSAVTSDGGRINNTVLMTQPLPREVQSQAHEVYVKPSPPGSNTAASMKTSNQPTTIGCTNNDNITGSSGSHWTEVPTSVASSFVTVMRDVEESGHHLEHRPPQEAPQSQVLAQPSSGSISSSHTSSSSSSLGTGQKGTTPGGDKENNNGSSDQSWVMVGNSKDMLMLTPEKKKEVKEKDENGFSRVSAAASATGKSRVCCDPADIERVTQRRAYLSKS